MTLPSAGRTRWSVGVVVPARDEEGTVGPCVASVRIAMAAAAARGWIVVVADGCHDATATVARAAIGSDGEVIECQAMSAGPARRVGTDRVLARLGSAPSRTWLATTDADGDVPPHWLRTQLGLAEAGAAAVAGVVRLDVGCDAGLAARHRASYTLHDDGTHPHVHGANLGVRGDAYAAAGGWGDQSVGEEHDLWDRIGRAGAVRLSSIESWVTTSSRRQGRAPDGFAADLAELAAIGDAP